MPIQDGKYVSPTWKNNAPPPLNASELNAMGQTLEQASNNYQRDEILKDTTKTTLGLKTTATPDEAFLKLKQNSDTTNQNVTNMKWTLLHSKTTSGSETYSLPGGYTKYLIYAIGGGGGGGVLKSVNVSSTSGGYAEGGGSGFARYAVITSSDNITSLNIVVGAGGTGGTYSSYNGGRDGNHGGTTSVKSGSKEIVIVEGGGGGSGGNDIRAAGGQPATMYNTIQFNGVDGDRFDEMPASAYGIMSWLQQEFPDTIKPLVSGGYAYSYHRNAEWSPTKVQAAGLYGKVGRITTTTPYTATKASGMFPGQGGSGVCSKKEDADTNAVTAYPGEDGAIYIFGGK